MCVIVCVCTDVISFLFYKIPIEEGVIRDVLEEYADRADFLMVYQREAHPSDRWSVGKKVSCVLSAKTLEDRIAAAR